MHEAEEYWERRGCVQYGYKYCSKVSALTLIVFVVKLFNYNNILLNNTVTLIQIFNNIKISNLLYHRLSHQPF